MTSFGKPLMLLGSQQSEPSGQDRQDRKRPDKLTSIQWHSGHLLVWDVTVVSPLAASYVDRAATGAGTVADMAAPRKQRNTRPYIQHTGLSLQQ